MHTDQKNSLFIDAVKIFILLVSLFIWLLNIKIGQLNDNIVDLKIKVNELYNENKILNIENDKLFQKIKLLKDDFRYLKNKIENDKIKKNQKKSEHDFKNRYYIKLLEFEGSYSNDPHDLGSETVYGITRKYQFDHKIWYMIDELKQILEQKSIYNIDELKIKIEESNKIQELVYNTYEQKWKKYRLNEFPFELSSQLFDIIINCGEYNAIKMLQYTLNAFNYRYQFGEDLNINGQFGENTINFLKEAINNGYINNIIESLVSLRIHHYIRIGNLNKTQRKFINGWIKRASVIY